MAQSWSEPCHFSGLKFFRPLLRAVVDGEDHDAFFLDAISYDKGGIRNDQLTSVGYGTDRPARLREQKNAPVPARPPRIVKNRQKPHVWESENWQ